MRSLHRSRFVRLLPTIAVGLVLLLALVAPSRKPATSSTSTGMPAIESLADCGLIQVPSITGYSGMQLNGGLAQPLGAEGNYEACSLTVSPNYEAHLRLDVLAWDANALAPDPTTVALRSLTFDISSNASWESKIGTGFGSTIVTQAVPGVADPPRSTTALELHLSYGGASVGSDMNSPSSGPTALAVSPDGSYQPLPGAHPMLSHFVCGGDASTQALRVIQCVMTADELNPGSGIELAQKFRVPVAATLQTVELAVGPLPYNIYTDQGTMFILDAEGQSEPPVNFNTGLFASHFYAPVGGRAAWVAPFQITDTPTLVPNHDYWLIVDTGLRYAVYMKDLTGTESPYFTTGIGPMFSRSATGHPFNYVPGRALDFRIIGTPANTVGISPHPPSLRALTLNVAPNPARGNVNVTWSSAVAGVRFEVLDERGRRVSLGDWQRAAEGRWTWSARNDRGQSVPAGVYFVHAVDGLGVHVTQRVVVLR